MANGYISNDDVKAFISSSPGVYWRDVMEGYIKEVTRGLSVPADFIRLSDPTLTFEDRVLLELKISLHSAWGLYRFSPNDKRNRLAGA